MFLLLWTLKTLLCAVLPCGREPDETVRDAGRWEKAQERACARDEV